MRSYNGHLASKQGVELKVSMRENKSNRTKKNYKDKRKRKKSTRILKLCDEKTEDDKLDWKL